MDIIRKLKPYEDCKLEIVTPYKTFRAILEFVDPGTTKIGLSNIQVLPSMKQEIGLLVLFPADILSYSILDKKKVKTDNLSAVQQRNAIMSTNYDAWLENVSESGGDNDDDDVSTQVEEEEEEGEFVLELPERFRDTLPNDHVLVDCVDDSFHAAIKHINQQDIIGVSFEGNDVSRFGELSIVSISSQWCTFLFDVLALKEDTFKRGLKHIFENPNIEKIIHDCVHPSDMAFRLYNTDFNNFFDTRLGNVCIKEIRNRNGKSQDKLWTVRQCIEKYLEIHREELSIPTKYTGVLKGAPPNWNKRPLPYALRAFAIQNVIFLRDLRSACIMNMLGEFYRGVNLLKNSLRNCSSESLKFGDVDLDLIFSGMNIRYVQMSDYIGGNKRNSIEAYLHKIKDYDVFKPLSTTKNNQYTNLSERNVASATNKKSKQLRKTAEYVIEEKTTTNKEVAVEQRKAPSREDTTQNTIPKMVNIIFSEDMITTTKSSMNEDKIGRTKLPLKENEEFNWSTAEGTDEPTSTSLPLIPAGFSEMTQKRRSRRMEH